MLLHSSMGEPHNSKRLFDLKGLFAKLRLTKREQPAARPLTHVFVVQERYYVDFDLRKSRVLAVLRRLDEAVWYIERRVRGLRTDATNDAYMACDEQMTGRKKLAGFKGESWNDGHTACTVHWGDQYTTVVDVQEHEITESGKRGPTKAPLSGFNEIEN